MRQHISQKDSHEKIIIKMSEGNPGATSVIKAILVHNQTIFFKTMHVLSNMNIRGEQLWVAYKYHCDGILEKFIAEVHANSTAMVETVNKYCGDEHTAICPSGKETTI